MSLRVFEKQSQVNINQEIATRPLGARNDILKIKTPRP